MLIYVDIDNTICITAKSDYTKSIPNKSNIEKINVLYDKGNTIIYWTARGGNSKVDHTKITKHQLDFWGCKYHKLSTNKPSFYLLIDDKTVRMDEL